MKTIFAILTALVLASAARADLTIEWRHKIPSLIEPLRVMQIGDKEITLRALPPEKKNDPQRLALFAGETRATKTPIYPGKLYWFAVVTRGDKTQWFMN